MEEPMEDDKQKNELMSHFRLTEYQAKKYLHIRYWAFLALKLAVKGNFSPLAMIQDVVSQANDKSWRSGEVVFKKYNTEIPYDAQRYLLDELMTVYKSFNPKPGHLEDALTEIAMLFKQTPQPTFEGLFKDPKTAVLIIAEMKQYGMINDAEEWIMSDRKKQAIIGVWDALAAKGLVNFPGNRTEAIQTLAARFKLTIAASTANEGSSKSYVDAKRHFLSVLSGNIR